MNTQSGIAFAWWPLSPSAMRVGLHLDPFPDYHQNKIGEWKVPLLVGKLLGVMWVMKTKGLDSNSYPGG